MKILTDTRTFASSQDSEAESMRTELRQLARTVSIETDRSNSRLQELASAVERMSAGLGSGPEDSKQSTASRDKDIRELAGRLEQLAGAQSRMERLIQDKEDGTVPRVEVTMLGAENLPLVDVNQKPDPYCTVTVGAEMAKTKIARKTTNPVWGDKAELHLETIDDVVRVRVYDWEVKHAHKLIGWADVSIDKLRAEGRFEDNLPLYKEDGNMLKGKDGTSSNVRISLTYLQGKSDLSRRVAECEEALKKMHVDLDTRATNEDLDAAAKQPITAVQQQVNSMLRRTCLQNSTHL
jgi:hypothetical protein